MKKKCKTTAGRTHNLRAAGQRKCEHEWVVFSTALQEVWLMLQCVECGAMGTVDDPTEEEWSQAFHAPSRPYRWHDDARVTVRHEICDCFYVVRTEPGAVCDCPAWDECCAELEYERVPVEIVTRDSPLTDEEREDLEDLAKVAIDGSLCSRLFPLFVHSFQDDTGREPSGAAKRIAEKIDKLDKKGMLFRPWIVARILREYIRRN